MNQLDNKKYRIALVILAVIGFLDSLFLSVEHFRGVLPPCSVAFKCDLVTTSAYSVMFGVPVSYLGLLYYLALFIGAILLYDKSENPALRKKFVLGLRVVSFLGLLFSARFTYIQGAILNAWCTYCIASALTTLLFFIAIHLENQQSKKINSV